MYIFLYSRTKTVVHAKEIQVCTRLSSKFEYQMGIKTKLQLLPLIKHASKIFFQNYQGSHQRLHDILMFKVNFQL